MSTAPVRLTSDVTGYYSGQTNGNIIAFIPDGEAVGCLCYQAWGDEVLVGYIVVDGKHRRQGVATRLIQHLEAGWPEKKLEWGLTTAMGTLLKTAYEKKIMESINEGNQHDLV